ncbi:hypothetical protein BDZ91DRAFT_779437, partial [Kalaharituber pfeilii]
PVQAEACKFLRCHSPFAFAPFCPLLRRFLPSPLPCSFLPSSSAPPLPLSPAITISLSLPSLFPLPPPLPLPASNHRRLFLAPSGSPSEPLFLTRSLPTGFSNPFGYWLQRNEKGNNNQK